MSQPCLPQGSGRLFGAMDGAFPASAARPAGARPSGWEKQGFGPNPCHCPTGHKSRLPSSDSQYSLDEAARPYENAGMEVLHLRRLDLDRNVVRFYSLTIEPTLFGTASLVREWGRIGTYGRRRVDLSRMRRGRATPICVLRNRKPGGAISPDNRRAFQSAIIQGDIDMPDSTQSYEWRAFAWHGEGGNNNWSRCQ